MVNPENTQGYFISIEGTEGAGKSTLAKFLHDYIVSLNIEVLLTREPGGTPVAEAIRQILLQNNEEKLWPKTEALLMFASRIQHLENKILPALKQGTWVISDRFADASYAYQGAGRDLGYDKIDALKEWCINTYEPTLTFLLDIPIELSVERLQERAHLDRIEQEKQDFFERIRVMYLALAKKFPQRFFVINASLEKHVVQALAKQRIDELLK